MKYKLAKILLIPLTLCLLYPSLTFASWYNPFSWFGSSDSMNIAPQTQEITSQSNESTSVWYNPFSWFGSGDSTDTTQQSSVTTNSLTSNSSGNRFSEPSKNIINDSKTGLNWMKCDYGIDATNGLCNPAPNTSIRTMSVGMGYTGSITNTNDDSSVFNMCENGVMCSDGTFQVVNWRSDAISHSDEYPAYTDIAGSGYVPAPNTAKARSCASHGGVANDTWKVPTFAQLFTLYDPLVSVFGIDQTFFPSSGGGVYMTEERSIGSYGTKPDYSDGLNFATGKVQQTSTGNLKCVSGESVKPSETIIPSISKSDTNTIQNSQISNLYCITGGIRYSYDQNPRDYEYNCYKYDVGDKVKTPWISNLDNESGQCLTGWECNFSSGVMREKVVSNNNQQTNTQDSSGLVINGGKSPDKPVVITGATTKEQLMNAISKFGVMLLPECKDKCNFEIVDALVQQPGNKQVVKVKVDNGTILYFDVTDYAK